MEKLIFHLSIYWIYVGIKNKSNNRIVAFFYSKKRLRKTELMGLVF